MNSPLIPILLIANYVIAVALIVLLWKKNVNYLKKVIWSVIILVPFAGLIFYAAFFNPAPPLEPRKRVGVSEYITPAGKERIDSDHGILELNTRNMRRSKKNENT